MAHRLATWGSLVLAGILISGGAAGAQEHSSSLPGGPNQAGLNEDPSADDVSVHTTAEDVLKALRSRRPLNPVVEPASALARRGTPAKPLLWPEGTAMVSRSGRIARDGQWWMFLPDDGDEGPIKLLPSATLEAMVRSTAGAAELSFVVSGELTVFQSGNYLLPRFATRSTGALRSAGPAGESAIRPVPPDHARREAENAGEAVAVDAPVDAVLERLQQLQPAQAAIPVADAPVIASPDGNLAAGRPALPEGSPLVERPGRLIADGSWWTFVFESDHPDYPEPPVKLLPNQNVELMIENTARDSAGLVFVVSGEVTVFEGESYLLPRAARRRIDSGNLRK